MSLQERNAFLDDMAKKRADIQKEITELNRKRQDYINDEIKKSGKPTDQAFEAAMLAAIRSQATRKNFLFEHGGE